MYINILLLPQNKKEILKFQIKTQSHRHFQTSTKTTRTGTASSTLYREDITIATTKQAPNRRYAKNSVSMDVMQDCTEQAEREGKGKPRIAFYASQTRYAITTCLCVIPRKRTYKYTHSTRTKMFSFGSSNSFLSRNGMLITQVCLLNLKTRTHRYTGAPCCWMDGRIVVNGDDNRKAKGFCAKVKKGFKSSVKNYRQWCIYPRAMGAEARGGRLREAAQAAHHPHLLEPFITFIKQLFS